MTTRAPLPKATCDFSAGAHFIRRKGSFRVIPTTDEAFIGQLCENLQSSMMSAAGGDYTEHRAYLGDRTYSSLKEVVELLDTENRPILMIWDGLDKPLSQGFLSGHLFGQMRDIFYGKRHKIVAAARSPFRDLARNKQVYDSEFQNLFDMNAVSIKPFDEHDVTEAMTTCGLTFTVGGKSELFNWTAYHPPLLLSLLNQLGRIQHKGPIDNETVNNTAKAGAEEVAEMLATLWDRDCSASAKDVYRLLVEQGELTASEVGRDERDCLLVRGFACHDGGKLKPACRLLQLHVRTSMPDAGSMVRLFGTWESYRAGIRSVLELRLKQIPVVNNRLHRLVERSIQDIPDFPDYCLNTLTNIEEYALDLIWEIEFGTAKVIPGAVASYWATPPRDKDNLVKKMMADDDWRIQALERWDQIRCLQLLTGSTKGFDSKANRISKDTYVLLNAIHSYRNRNQHAEGQQMHVGVAVAAVMTCLEMLSCLARELV